MIIRTESGSLYELEPNRARRLGNAEGVGLDVPGAWYPTEGHSAVVVGRAVCIYLEGHRPGDHVVITSPVVEVLC